MDFGDKKAKLLTKIRKKPKNISYKDLIKLLEVYGLTCVNIKGDHFQYSRNGFRTLTIPRKNPVWIEIVKQVLRTIDEIIEMEK